MKLSLIFAVMSAVVSSAAYGQSKHVKIASIDAGRVVAENSIEAARTRDAIKKLQRACPKEKADFPDRITSVTKQELSDKGLYTTATEVIEGVQAIMINYEGQDCTDAFAYYLTTRKTTGFNHAEAVASVRALMVAANAAARR